jgi:GNAT superfamily N-acetyltransferase
MLRSFIQFLEEEHIPVKIRQFKNNPNAFGAYHKNKRVGAAIHWNDITHGKPSIYKSEVHPDYRKKGVATQLYKHIEKHIGKELHPATSLSDDAFHFWKKYRPEAVKDDLRHHKDKLMGKEIEHPVHGKGKIESVGSGNATVRLPSGQNFIAGKEMLRKHGHDI